MSEFWSDPSSTSIPEPSLVAYVISTIISWAGSNAIFKLLFWITGFQTFWNQTASQCIYAFSLRIFNYYINGCWFSKKLVIWAAPSEFVSSSIPSWQISTAHAQPFRGATDLAFCLKVPLDSLLVWASSEGSGETARMRRLAWTFAARIGDKYQIRLARPIWYTSGKLLNTIRLWKPQRRHIKSQFSQLSNR